MVCQSYPKGNCHGSTRHAVPPAKIRGAREWKLVAHPMASLRSQNALSYLRRSLRTDSGALTPRSPAATPTCGARDATGEATAKKKTDGRKMPERRLRDLAEAPDIRTL
eukprot:scaffold576_cov260-Pinguiococcus_pyrenoidosus.AAC.10